ncbi:MAG: hypothetical protein EXS38_06085 [Opitutus sp.]|nr:hypothetical protein [Opitutus sp.]
MRLVRLALLLLLPGLAVARAADVEFVRVWPGWRDAASFERIGEYFGGEENNGKQVVLRTHADARAGYYFLVRVKNRATQASARFELTVIQATTLAPKTFAFTAALPAHETVFQLGLTGADYPEGKKVHPVAWKLVLLGADGRVLAEQKSFLWEKPAK